VPSRGLPQGSSRRRHTTLVMNLQFSNGPAHRSVKLALGYVTAATSGCTPHCQAHGEGKRCKHDGCQGSRSSSRQCVL
jgi:hypothetical protein